MTGKKVPGVTVADDSSCGYELFSDYDVLPFMERDGEYWGAPADGQTGFHEVERQRLSSVQYIVIVWPAFWWLDYYSALHEHLQPRYHCALGNSRLVIYDLHKVLSDDCGNSRF